VENKGRYGYRRVTLELRHRGFTTNHKLVMKLMKQAHLTCMLRVKKYHSYRGEVGKIAPNLLKRNFKAMKPNLKWVTDITQFKIFGQKLYLSPILDLFNGEIISYTLSKSPNFQQITNMLQSAFLKIPNNTQLLLHSDQGWHYQMQDYQKMLKDKGIRQSMSRKGNCYDNSVMENFFGILKSEFYYNKKFLSIEHFTKELSEYIDYYNNRRIKVKLKGLSPVQFRTQSFISS
jgi:putative transposase